MSDDLSVAPATYAPTGHPEWTAPLAPLADSYDASAESQDASVESQDASAESVDERNNFPILHSTVAQQILKDTYPITFDEFIREITAVHKREYTPLEKNVLFLAHLCACGLLNEANEFILTIENHHELLDTTMFQLYDGTVLNMALYWNSGDLGYEFFKMLTSYGAYIYYDCYDCLPYQQDGTFWTTIIDDQPIGKRNPTEFQSVYTKINEELKK